jgi:hypothetical protein
MDRETTAPEENQADRHAHWHQGFTMAEERLSIIREVAKRLDVAPNTVRNAIESAVPDAPSEFANGIRRRTDVHRRNGEGPTVSGPVCRESLPYTRMIEAGPVGHRPLIGKHQAKSAVQS